MTDIVESLQDISLGPSAELEKLGREAAAEITRLRADLAARDAEVARLREDIDTWESVFPDIAPSQVLPDRSLVEIENKRLRAAMQEIIDFDTDEDITNEECMRDIARAALETREAGVLAKPLEVK